MRYNIKIGNHQFIIYYPYYKDKILINLIQTFVCTKSYLYFKYNLDGLRNFSVAFFSTHNSSTYVSKLDMVTKKRKPLKTLLIYITNIVILKHLKNFKKLPILLRNIRSVTQKWNMKIWRENKMQ